MAINNSIDTRRFERRLYLVAAILFPLIVLVGFARSYYLKGYYGTPSLPSLTVHLHGLVMSAWVLLFILQVWFISSKRIRLHQKLGYVGVALAIAILITGFLTAVNAAKFGSPSFPRDIPPLAFIAVPLGDLLVFAILFGAAIYYRKRPANHKRLILLTVINFLPPALARIDFLAPFGPLTFFGIPAVLAIAALIIDTWRMGKLNKVFAAATVFVVAAFPLRLIVAGTDAWMRFATWLTS